MTKHNTDKFSTILVLYVHHHTPLSVLKLIFAFFGHPAFIHLEEKSN